MSNTTLEKEIANILQQENLFVFKSINHVNSKPHPYVIGPAHIKHASDNHMGMLGEATMKVVKCAHPGCHVSYEQHTSDHVLFVSLTRNCKNKEAQDELKKLVTTMEQNKIDGIAFVETPENYRIE